jgi:GNAT superfamily N-acetyltransferase
MYKLRFIKSDLKNIEPLFDEYLQTLTDVTDDFWEEHIIEADIYEIQKDESAIGFFSIAEKANKIVEDIGNKKRNDKILTSFYIYYEYLVKAQGIFKQILADYKIQTASVTTCDKLFLNLCLDFHKKIEMQAYYFDGTKIIQVREPEYKREFISEIKPEEITEINSKTENFFHLESPEAYLKSGQKIFRLAENGEDLGYGIIFRKRLSPEYYDCGMVTLPEHRQKGVGRSLLIHMANIIRENGGIPVAGCWYYNINSKRTFESAGRFSNVRLLNVWFVDKAE